MGEEKKTHKIRRGKKNQGDVFVVAAENRANDI